MALAHTGVEDLGGLHTPVERSGSRFSGLGFDIGLDGDNSVGAAAAAAVGAGGAGGEGGGVGTLPGLGSDGGPTSDVATSGAGSDAGDGSGVAGDVERVVDLALLVGGGMVGLGGASVDFDLLRGGLLTDVVVVVVVVEDSTSPPSPDGDVCNLLSSVLLDTVGLTFLRESLMRESMRSMVCACTRQEQESD